MADEEHVELLQQGVKVWNKWREENPEVRPDLSSIDLSGEFDRRKGNRRKQIDSAERVEIQRI